MLDNGDAEHDRLTSDRIECDSVTTSNVVPTKAPVEIAAVADEGEGSGIKDLDFIALRPAENFKVAFHVLVGGVDATELRILVVIDDHVLVRILTRQLGDHGLRER